jgi:hypothetical protein
MYVWPQTYFIICVQRTSNHVESANSKLGPVRCEGPLKAAEKFLEMIMTDYCQAQVELSKMVAAGNILTNFALKELDVAKVSARACLVQQAGPHKVYVTLTNTLHSPRRLVDLQRKTCECLHWQQDGRPCYHAVGAFGKTDLMQRMMPELLVGHAWFKYAWDDIYTVKGFKLGLGTADVLLPQRHLLKIDPNVLVQLDTKTPGRPRRTRMRNIGEGGSRNSRKKPKYKCSRCGANDHTLPRCNNGAAAFL